MTVYNTNPDQCELSMNLNNLLYVITLNATIIFLPVVVLVALYIAIIIKSWNNYRNHIQICSLSRINYNKESNLLTMLHETYNLKNFSTNIGSRITTENGLNSRSMTVNNCIIRLSPSTSRISSNMIEIDKNRLSSHGSLISLDNAMKEKAKKEFKSIFKLSTVTIVSFFFQLPRRVFLCWSYLNSYWSIFSSDYFENFFEQYNNWIDPIFFVNAINLIFLLYLIFNSIIYNMFSVKFRNALTNAFKLASPLNRP